MHHHAQLEQLQAEVSTQLGHLNNAMVKTLTVYVFGMLLTRHCGQHLIAATMSSLLDIKFNTLRQRLRELLYEPDAKRGRLRRELDVHSCFAPLLRWVMSKFDAQQRHLLLAMDVTYLRDRFTILTVSVVFAGSALPVAWQIRSSTQNGAWNPLWLRLLLLLKAAVPADWTVVVLADSGLYSKALFSAIRSQLRWQVQMRISGQGLCRQPNGKWLPLAQLAQRGMTPTAQRLICFKAQPLRATLLVQWAADCDSPCFVLTNLLPTQAPHCTYSLRFWIECGFKDLKRGGLHWEQCKLSCPQRAERLWLVLSITLLQLATWTDLPETAGVYTLPRFSWLTRGWLAFMVALLNGDPKPTHRPFAYDPAFLPRPKNTYP